MMTAEFMLSKRPVLRISAVSHSSLRYFRPMFIVFRNLQCRPNPDITPKRVKMAGPLLRSLAAGKHKSEETLPRWRTVDATAPDLTGPGIEIQTYRLTVGSSSTSDYMYDKDLSISLHV